MTRAEAAQIISRAILAEGNHQHILGADAFAARLATALDALGLLNLAEVYGVAPNPEAQDALATSPTGEHAAITQQDQPTEPDRSPDQPAWATKRQRA